MNDSFFDQSSTPAKKVCDRCRGAKIILTLICKHCEGMGCSACSGDGKRTLHCRVCSGVGVVEQEVDIDSPDFD
jgi:DnaJ-class molecular chaperone